MPGSYSLARALRAGETVFMGWVGTPDALVVETVARSKFGAVNLDMQHGWHSPESVLNVFPQKSFAALRSAESLRERTGTGR